MSEINIDAEYGLITLQDLQIVYVDNRYAQIYGYKNADDLLVNTNSFLDLIDPAFHHETYSNYQKLIEGTLTPKGKTYTNIDRNGRQFTVFTVDHVVQWNGRKAVQVTVIDMSVVDRVDEHINHRNLMYKKLITESAQAIIIHRNFKPLLVNNTFVQAIQASSISELLRTNNLASLVVKEPEYREKLSKAYNAIYQGQLKGHKGQMPIVTLAGERRIFDIYSDYVEWEGGPAIRSVFEDVTELAKLKKQLEKQAMTDQLSQLYNRHAIYKWLDENDFSHTPLYCILIDIDDFKSINDTFGHNTGDEAIKMVATFCKEEIDNKGIVGRWGGEEFVIFSCKSSCDEMFSLVENIRKKCAKAIVHYKDDHTQLTISAGVTNSTLSCPEKFDITKMIKDVDALLHQAKNSGKNQVRIACI